MAGISKEAVCFSHERLSLNQNTHRTYLHSCINMRPADGLIWADFSFSTCISGCFEARDSIWKPTVCEIWCEPGSNTTQCLRGPTKAQWYTDRHGTFSILTQTKALHCGSNGSQSETLKGGALPGYWSATFDCLLLPIHLPEWPDYIRILIPFIWQSNH